MKPVQPIIPGRDLPVTNYAEGQGEYQTLPAYREDDGTVLTRWHLNWRERLRVLWHGDVYLWLLTFNQPLQPVMLQVEAPQMPAKGRKAYWLGGLFLTTCKQGTGAPFIDRCTSRDLNNGRDAKGVAILLTPWRRNRYGESEIQTALVIGWRKDERNQRSTAAQTGSPSAGAWEGIGQQDQCAESSDGKTGA